jgi:hypothetical protein
MLALLAALSIVPVRPPFSDDPAIVLLGGGTPGSRGVPRLVVTGSPSVGSPFGLELVDGRPGATGVVAIAASDAPLPLPQYGAVVHPSEPFLALIPFVVASDGTSPQLVGVADVGQGLCGVTFAAQALVVDERAVGGLAFTSSRRVTLGADPRRRLFTGEFLPSENRRVQVTTADLDGDGRSDVCFVEFVSNGLGVLSTRADGWFHGPALTALGASPGRYTLADFDGDGELDAAVLLPGGQVGVALGRGDGTFEAPLVQRAGAVALDVAAGDFDGDGALDLVTAGGALAAVSVLRGNGDGTFGLPFLVPTSHPSTAVLVVDATGDGELDVVSRNTSNSSVSLLAGRGDGTFATATTLGASSPPGDIVALDLDADGRVDLLKSNTTSTLNVWKGVPGGGLGPRIDVNVATPFELDAIADLDGDSELDLVGWDSGDLKVLRGLGGGTAFAVHQVIDDVPAGTSTALGDFNDDGETDVVFTTANGSAAGELVVLHGIGGGRFDAPSTSPSVVATTALLRADYDGDDLDDIVHVLSASNPSLRLQRNLGGGAFAPPVGLAGTLGGAEVVARDFDGDGLLDFVVADSTADVVRFVFGSGGGAFAAPVSLVTGTPALGVDVGDVDGNGLDDIVVRETSSTAAVHLATGPRQLGPRIAVDLGPSTSQLLLADVDGDAVLDLLSLATPPQLRRMLGHGDGTFGSPVPYPTQPNPEDLQAADMDGDGDLDVVIDHIGGYGIQRNDGDGDFFAQPLVPKSFSATAPVVADIDNDGDIDVVGSREAVPGTAWDVVWIAVNTGSGTFEPLRRHYATEDPWAVTVGDFDGDTLPDIVVMDRKKGELGLLFDRRAP